MMTATKAVLDPVDAAAMNFGLQKSSVVFDRLPGFRPIPFEKIGIQNKTRRTLVTPKKNLGTSGKVAGQLCVQLRVKKLSIFVIASLPGTSLKSPANTSGNFSSANKALIFSTCNNLFSSFSSRCVLANFSFRPDFSKTVIVDKARGSPPLPSFIGNAYTAESSMGNFERMATRWPCQKKNTYR